MRLMILPLVATLTAVGVAGGIFGHDEKEAMKAAIHKPADLQWKDGPASLPPGAKIAVLEGDPAKAGPQPHQRQRLQQAQTAGVFARTLPGPLPAWPLAARDRRVQHLFAPLAKMDRERSTASSMPRTGFPPPRHKNTDRN